jgi:putative ABC transport system permease protein
VSAILRRDVSLRMEKEGVVVYVANGTWNAEGLVDQTRPPEWDAGALDIVVSDIASVDLAAPVFVVPFDEVMAGGKSWRVRTVVGTSPEYFSVFSLDLIEGLPMTADDVSLGRRYIWISEETAVLLFGSAEDAVGEAISPPGRTVMRGPGGERQRGVVPQYSVRGVYADPPEVARRSYGIGDMLFPYTSLMPAGSNAAMTKNFMAGLFVVRGSGSSAERVSASVRELLARSYGEDIDILTWEGSPLGRSSYMEELRQAVRIFTVSVNILGIVILVTSSLGIFSTMVVESLNRKRDIALERALGASRAAVVREFWLWSAALSCVGAALGALIAFLLSGPVCGAVAPLVGEAAADLSGETGLDLLSVAVGFILAVGCGGVLGLLPALSAVRGSISDTLREA